MIAACICIITQQTALAWGKKHRQPPAPAVRSTTLTFVMRDGSCRDGIINKIDRGAVEVRTANAAPVSISRADLLQVSQNGSLVYSARSSWADVEAIHLFSRESLVVRLRNAKVISGKPYRVESDQLVYKVGIWRKKRYAKDRIATVDYLRVKPDSSAFDRFAQESPAMLFFYPDYYDRLSGLEGRIPVRLYDALMPQDDKPLTCSKHD